MSVSLYWVVFAAVFLAVAVWESVAPLRPVPGAVERRWAQHGLLMAVTAVLLTLVMRLGPFAVALVASQRPGARLAGWPWAVSVPVTILLIDLLHYAVHWSCHHAGWLWRVHEVHHSDAGYDVSTAVRFHPLESLLSKLAVAAMVAVLGPPAAAVLASELLTVTLNLVVHGNVAWPAPVERWLRLVFVTPALHRIHHSAHAADHNRNFGQSLTLWDRLFGTFLPQSAQGADFATGLESVSEPGGPSAAALLRAPFRRPNGA